MSVNVYFASEFSANSIRALFERAYRDMPEKLSDGDRVAMKVHFGEKGNTRFVSPQYIRPIIAELKKYTSDYFLTDSNTLYRGSRLTTSDHIKQAHEHGFGALDTRIIIADGETGSEEITIPINKHIFSNVKIAKQIAISDALVVISHFKGHLLFGFGGAIKNIGMGGGSRAGKLEMHSKIKPSVGKGCTGCGNCVEHCPADAITMNGDKAVIDEELCIGCAQCISVCDYDAIQVPWHGARGREVRQRCAEYAYGALLGKKKIFITFINNITKDCDCLADTRLIGKDVGIVASIDPVACDRAAFDLVYQNHGNKDIFKEVTNVDGTQILDYAEEIGLGTQSYGLIGI